MKITLSTGEALEAARCPHCSMLISPMRFLEEHEKIHAARSAAPDTVPVGRWFPGAKLNPHIRNGGGRPRKKESELVKNRATIDRRRRTKR